MTGIASVTGGRITVVDPAPGTGGVMIPRSGTGRAAAAPGARSGLGGVSLRGRDSCRSLPEPGGNVGLLAPGRTTSGITCAQTGAADKAPTTNPAETAHRTNPPFGVPEVTIACRRL